MTHTPNKYKHKPWGSILGRAEYEIIALNIMVILDRTGNTFRKLEWDEYKAERLRDGNFSDGEKKYFDEVQYLSEGKVEDLQNFSKDWDFSTKK
jgi:hypothetical protein